MHMKTQKWMLTHPQSFYCEHNNFAQFTLLIIFAWVLCVMNSPHKVFDDVKEISCGCHRCATQRWQRCDCNTAGLCGFCFVWIFKICKELPSTLFWLFIKNNFHCFWIDEVFCIFSQFNVDFSLNVKPMVKLIVDFRLIKL